MALSHSYYVTDLYYLYTHLTRRFKFPSVFIVYQMFPLGLFEIFLLIAFTDRERLFCSQRDLVGSLVDSTPFCTVQGVFMDAFSDHYTIVELHRTYHSFCRCGLPLHFDTISSSVVVSYLGNILRHKVPCACKDF